MILDAVVEMPRGSSYKYELDKETNSLVIDRVLDIQVPFNYGFIPGTLSNDGDPLDCFVASVEAITPNTKVKVRVVGVFRCIDGLHEDDKLIGFLVGEDEAIKTELEPVKNLIKYYLENYKKGFRVLSYEEVDKLEIPWIAKSV